MGHLWDTLRKPAKTYRQEMNEWILGGEMSFHLGEKSPVLKHEAVARLLRPHVMILVRGLKIFTYMCLIAAAMVAVVYGIFEYAAARYALGVVMVGFVIYALGSLFKDRQP